jgi:hypothetical protein
LIYQKYKEIYEKKNPTHTWGPILGAKTWVHPELPACANWADFNEYELKKLNLKCWNYENAYWFQIPMKIPWFGGGSLHSYEIICPRGKARSECLILDQYMFGAKIVPLCTYQPPLSDEDFVR